MNQNNLRRKCLSYLTGGIAGTGVFLAGIPFFRSLSPSKYNHQPYTDIDISGIKPGAMSVTEHQGKPIYVFRRTVEQIKELEKYRNDFLDPDSQDSKQPSFAKSNTRSLKPEYFVSVGICTHLGCAVKYIKDDQEGHLPQRVVGGYFCPCHGAEYDGAGRVFQNGPAPRNLEVPDYEFTENGNIRVFNQ